MLRCKGDIVLFKERGDDILSLAGVGCMLPGEINREQS